mmetsp:Transcript_14297/g.20297  ORF Transcript_14297/g.20297 Transcript_14297/m.20297 type:complete len:241 (+) Transcript_14297:304-1026(+)
MDSLISSSLRQRSIILLGILFFVCNNLTDAAWTTTTPIKHSHRSKHRDHLHCRRSRGWSTTQLSYRDNEHDSGESNNNKKKSPTSPAKQDFQSRMKRVALQRIRNSSSNSGGRRGGGRGTSWRPPNVKTAISLEDFANVIQEGRTNNQLVVVRFYATWCKKCQAIRPSFDKVASSKPQVIFVDVPVTNTNVELHQGLKVTSVPFAHIYCPEKGLVVEEKISRSRFSEFEELVEKHSSFSA